ncbi:Asr1405/Asl0597 family protein [Mastigocladopsis repens]|uniref:Asr1405/Asl0597 family protein n=1 Tax=Mastigocladopsis repens TaxID=221287 RepID=UPI0002EDE647|nr:Asr1405/Asl0597 family protein [Mastigocladopsis repens]
MLQPCNFQASDEHIVQIPVSARWQIYHRLQELMIKSWCLPDGSLRVQVNNCLTAILVRSTVLQFMASRQELIDLLERCWQL